MGGARRKYTKELLADLVAQSYSVAEVLRRLGLHQAGGTHAHISRTIKAFEIDTSHFAERPQPNGAAKRRLHADEILVRLLPGSKRRHPYLLKRALVEIGRAYACVACGNKGTWNGQDLLLEIDHIDGDYHNNEAWNLRFLCPNCHSQTESFSGRSRNKYVEQTGQLMLFGTVRGMPPTP